MYTRERRGYVMNLVKKVQNQLSPQIAGRDKNIQESLTVTPSADATIRDYKFPRDCRRCPLASQCHSDKITIS